MSGSGIVAIVLAAGGSHRMGAPKMLADLGGRPLVLHTVEAALASRADEVRVVTGDTDAEVRAALSGLAIRFVPNPDWEEGLSSSIRAGLTGDERAAIVILGDQPALESGILDALIDAHENGHERAACRYEDGTLGPPALFGRAWFPALQTLEGDRGARALLDGPDPDGSAAAILPFPGGALDVDTPDDLARARAGRDPE